MNLIIPVLRTVLLFLYETSIWLNKYRLHFLFFSLFSLFPPSTQTLIKLVGTGETVLFDYLCLQILFAKSDTSKGAKCILTQKWRQQDFFFFFAADKDVGNPVQKEKLSCMLQYYHLEFFVR